MARFVNLRKQTTVCIIGFTFQNQQWMGPAQQSLPQLLLEPLRTRLAWRLLFPFAAITSFTIILNTLLPGSWGSGLHMRDSPF